MTRLTKADEKRATEALAECAAATKHIDDPKELNEAVYNVLSKRLGDKPELLKRACEGYNSAKSVYRLGAATDDTRGNDFAIVDAPALAKRAADEARGRFIAKAASAAGVCKAQFCKCAPNTERIHKVASSSAPVEDAVAPMRKLSNAEIMWETTEYLDDIRYSLRKVASSYNDVVRSITAAEDSFIQEMRRLSPQLRKQASEVISSAYGDVGDLLISVYNASTCAADKIDNYSKSKYKGSVSIPDEPVYKKASEAISTHIIAGEAHKITKGFTESAFNIVKDLFNTTSGRMTKEAAASDILGKTLLGSELIESMPKLTGGKSKNELEDEINTTELINILQQHSIQRAFMKTVADPVVTRYPLHQVTLAFNDALSELPIHMRKLPPSAFSALLKSRTIARLGRGGAASASDVDQIQQIQQVYGRINPAELASVVMQGGQR